MIASMNPPKIFAAEDGWRYFGSFVEGIERELSCLPQNTRGCAMRPIMLITTNANLLANTLPSLHVSGLERFWKQICRAFENAVMLTITIVVVRRTSVRHTMKTIKKYHDSHESASPLEDEGYTLDATLLPSLLHVIQCLNDIQQRIKELSQDAQSTHLMTAPIKLNLEFIEGNSILFQSLLQARVNVIQTIPLSSVDSLLIFGVPMSAQASLENDLCRYNEMKMLVCQLWKYLSRNDVALVLLVRPLVLLVRPLSNKNLDGREYVSSSCSRYPREQLFLLAYEELVQKQPHALYNESNLDFDSFQIIPDKSCQGKLPSGEEVDDTSQDNAVIVNHSSIKDAAAALHLYWHKKVEWEQGEVCPDDGGKHSRDSGMSVDNGGAVVGGVDGCVYLSLGTGERSNQVATGMFY